MKKSASPKPPKELSLEARRFWSKVVEEFAVNDPAGRMIIATACEAFERMRQAQEILSREGLTVTDRYGQVKPHPCASIERDSRSSMLSALKALRLDVEPLNARPGAQPGKIVKR